jgi:hypothetical protein
MEGDVHAKNNQEGSADEAHVGKDLENTAKSLPLKRPEDYPLLGL